MQREGRLIGKRAARVIGVRPANRPDFDPADKPLLQTIDQLPVIAWFGRASTRTPSCAGRFTFPPTTVVAKSPDARAVLNTRQGVAAAAGRTSAAASATQASKVGSRLSKLVAESRRRRADKQCGGSRRKLRLADRLRLDRAGVLLAATFDASGQFALRVVEIRHSSRFSLRTL